MQQTSHNRPPRSLLSCNEALSVRRALWHSASRGIARSEGIPHHTAPDILPIQRPNRQLLYWICRQSAIYGSQRSHRNGSRFRTHSNGSRAMARRDSSHGPLGAIRGALTLLLLGLLAGRVRRKPQGSGGAQWPDAMSQNRKKCPSSFFSFPLGV